RDIPPCIEEQKTNEQLIDRTGKRFGKYQVIRRDGSDRNGKVMWLCVCEGCGNEIRVHGNNNLTQGRRGCHSCSRKFTTHGGCNTVEYKSWCHIIDRCTNSSSQDWAYYGGRGIKVCARWRNSFENFLNDMGRKPTAKH